MNNRFYRANMPTLAQILLMLNGVLLSTFAQNSVPKMGDLSIYSAGNGVDKSPTIMLVLEGSTLTNLVDGIGEQSADTEVIDIATWSNTVPRYKRFGSYVLSHTSGAEESKLYPSRLTRMKDALFYLMDTPGLLSDDYRIGLTRYSGGIKVKDNPRLDGDGHTANVVTPAKRLGPVVTNYDFATNSQGNFVKDNHNRYIPIQHQKYAKVSGRNRFYPVNTGNWAKKQGIYYKQRGSKYLPNAEGNFIQDGNGIRAVSTQDFIRFRGGLGYNVDENHTKAAGVNRLQTYSRTCSGSDGEGNRVENSQRCAIKTYVAAMCDADVLCTGAAPMAGAYSEAGAYMMGTKTSALVNRPSHVPADSIVYPRVLRQHNKSKAWQYCPPKYRQTIFYTFTQDNEPRTLYRLECPETVNAYNDSGIEEEISAWVDINKHNIANYEWSGADNNASVEELNQVRDKRQYDLLWSEVSNSPYGAKNDAII